jgi:hypothetical protein
MLKTRAGDIVGPQMNGGAHISDDVFLSPEESWDAKTHQGPGDSAVKQTG